MLKFKKKEANLMFFEYDKTKKIELGGGLSRRILAHGEDMMAVEVTFEKGALGAIHTHPQTQITYVLRGRFEATLGNTTKILEVGDSYLTTPNLPHGVLCLEEGALLDVFTPRREDFLK